MKTFNEKMENNKKWYFSNIVIFVLLFIFNKASFPQEELVQQSINSNTEKFQIEKVIYKIDGITKVYPLKLAVPINKSKIFNYKEELEHYLNEIKSDFTNIRTIQSSSLETLYGEKIDGIIYVTVTIIITDTWNVIALPYPRFDSNSGLLLKLKIKDYNFLGMLRVLNVDLSYRFDENEKSQFEIGGGFDVPFKASILDGCYSLSSAFSVQNAKVGFELNNGLDFMYSSKHADVHFGVEQGFTVNSGSGKVKKSTESTSKTVQDNQGVTEPLKQTDEKGDTDLYYFSSSIYTYVPVTIYNFNRVGKLVWTPYISLSGNWAFKPLKNNEKKGMLLSWRHSLSFGKINWRNNFRHGFNMSFSNSYSYNFFLKSKIDTDFCFDFSGYYSFWDRIGITGQLRTFYNLHGKTSKKAGETLRGILDKRVETDLAAAFNFDIPVKISTFYLEEITGVSWTRYFSFELQVVPFLDIALTHDAATGRYFHFYDGWYAGGVQLILYPVKMRSIYGRISLGYDLSELKNVKGLQKLKGKALRDGESIAEIFIGIGLHY